MPYTIQMVMERKFKRFWIRVNWLSSMAKTLLNIDNPAKYFFLLKLYELTLKPLYEKVTCFVAALRLDSVIFKCRFSIDSKESAV